MIKFFRKIRQQLIQQNRMGKYFKYAIGEILLVVIGILIALQINNWNENRQNRILETQFYKRLLEDLKEEQAIIQSVVNYSNQVLLHAKRAVKVFENPNLNVSNPSQTLIDMYQASQLQDPTSTRSTYLEMISSGQINLIKSDTLKTKLIRHYEIEWEKNALFSMHNKYRENLRGKMPDDIQAEIRNNCNDIYIKLRYTLEASLPKKCIANIPLNDAVKTITNKPSINKFAYFFIKSLFNSS